MDKLQWHIEERSIDSLKHWDKNPRTITGEAFEKLKDRIIKRGMHDVLKVDLDGTVLSGNQRLEALKQLGIATVDCIVPNRALTDEERDKVALESNRNDGAWDWQMLGERFDPDLLGEIGFDSSDIDKAFDLKTPDIEDVEIEELQAPITKLGDIYLLGNHRLMCGSATELADMEKLMNGKYARLVFTDPPYGVNYKPISTHGATKSKHQLIQNDELTGEKLSAFIKDAFTNLYSVTTDDACFYCWHATSTADEFKVSLEATGLEVHQTIIWIKDRFTLSRSDFQHAFEPCFYAWKKGQAHFTNTKIRNLSDIISLEYDDFSSLMDIWYVNRDNMAEYGHPTQKPVGLAEKAIKKSSEIGDIVLDVFGGSGGTLLACEGMKRIGYMMELDPKYCDLIVKRWENLTGQKAVKENA